MGHNERLFGVFCLGFVLVDATIPRRLVIVVLTVEWPLVTLVAGGHLLLCLHRRRSDE